MFHNSKLELYINWTGFSLDVIETHVTMIHVVQMPIVNHGMTLRSAHAHQVYIYNINEKSTFTDINKAKSIYFV